MSKILLSVSCFFSIYTLSAQQNILWEKSIGGKQAEYVYNAISTPDYGFLIIGSSSSDATGDLKKTNQGSLDYFIWKMDEDGHQEWQNSFGGNSSDFLYVAKPTSDGGYILAGASTSSKSGDKSSVNQGAEDIWVIKIDANGTLQWQNSFGGNGNDIPVDIIPTKDGGYLIGAKSNSIISEFKKAENFGANDYYVIKLNGKGELLWENTFGGMFDDSLKSIIETNDGFLLIGNSNSNASGNKTIDQNSNATWIVKIDQKGNMINEYNLGLNSDNQLISFQKRENEFIFSVLNKENEQFKPKIILTDFNLKPLKSTDLEVEGDLSITEIKSSNNQYILTANQISTFQKKKKTTDGIESYYIAKSFDENGTELWAKEFGDKGFNYLEKAITTRDGSLILFGNSTQSSKGNNGQSDFYLVKLGKENDDIKRVYIEAYPNPTSDIVNVLINKDFKKASIDVYNLVGQKLQSKEVKYRSTPISLGNYPGGIYILKIKTDNKTESIKIIKK